MIDPAEIAEQRAYHRRMVDRALGRLDTIDEPTIADLPAIMDALIVAADLEAHALGLDRLLRKKEGKP